MSTEQAKNFGLTETLKWTLYTFLTGELIFLFLETRGDFANGLLFFMEAHMNIHYLAMVTILLVLTYLFGQRNGLEILILNKNFFVTPFKYGLLTIWTVLIYVSTVGLLKQPDKESVGTLETIMTYIAQPYIRTTLIFLLPLAIYSYICGDRIRRNKLE